MDIEDKEEAEGYLAFWCDLADDNRVFPFIKATNTIRTHWSDIINYLKSAGVQRKRAGIGLN